MRRSVLDTDIYSEIVKGKDASVAARADEHLASHKRLTISIVTVIEVVKGWHRLNREDRVQRFLGEIRDIEVLPLGVKAAEMAGRIQADLERAGTPVGYADALVAAIALRHGVPLISGNTSHFVPIQVAGYSLVLSNWREEV